MALNSTGKKLACSLTGTGRIAFFDVVTGGQELKLAQHTGLIQTLVVSDDVVVGVGTYSGRSQTTVTTWELTRGDIIAESSCPLETIQARSPLAF